MYKNIAMIQRRMSTIQGLHWFAVGIFFPIMSLAILAKGITYLQLGTSMATYSAAVVLFELPTGGLADSLGRKQVYLISLAITFLGTLLFLLSASFYSILVAMFLMGLARALASGSVEAHFIDALYEIEPGMDIQPVMARVGSIVPLALGAGSLIGGFLPELKAFTPFLAGIVRGSDGNFQLNLLVILIVTVVEVAMTIQLVHEEQAERVQPLSPVARLAEGFRKFPQTISQSVVYGIQNRSVFILALAGLFWGFSISGLEQFWQPQVKDILGADSQYRILGYLSFGYFASGAIGNMLSTPLSTILRRNYTHVLIISRLLMGGLFLMLATRSGIAGFSTFYLLTFTANGLASSPESTVMNAAVPAQMRSTILSFASLTLQAGGFVGSLVMGYLAMRYSISGAWTVAAGTLLISSGLYIFLPRSTASEPIASATIQEGRQESHEIQ